VKMIRENCERKEIDSEICGEEFELLLDPNFPMIVVYSGNGIDAQQKAAAY